MKGATNIFWKQLEAEAKIQEERVKDLAMEVPEDAKSSEELFQELMEKIREQAEE